MKSIELTVKLSQLKIGETAYIAGFSVEDRYLKRFFSLGIGLGAQVKLIKTVSGSFIAEIDGHTFCVRSEAAERIEVKNA